HRIDVFTAAQIKGVLQGESGVVPVNGAAVHQQPGGHVNGEQQVVPVQLGQWIGVRRTHRQPTLSWRSVRSYGAPAQKGNGSSGRILSLRRKQEPLVAA